MNEEQARALFDRALDDELDPESLVAFQQALAQHASLREEYAQLCAVSRAAHGLVEDTHPVDLLAGVQQKLRARSGGKFYRDRFAEQRGQGSVLRWLLLTTSAVMVAVSLWFAFAM